MYTIRIILAGVVALVLSAGAARAQAVVLVVNQANAVSSISRSEASGIFLKKQLRFSNGAAAVPVDLAKDAPTRASFSKTVLGRSASAVAAYWQQQIFAGRDVPPVEKSSDAEVLAFVRANPGAVGYVSAGVPLGDGVKAVALR